MAKPSNPTLWKRVKNKRKASSRGGPAGRWSARKSVLAKLQYRSQGGRWLKTTPPPLRRVP